MQNRISTVESTDIVLALLPPILGKSEYDARDIHCGKSWIAACDSWSAIESRMEHSSEGAEKNGA